MSNNEPNKGTAHRCPYATLNLVGADNRSATHPFVSDDEIRDAYKRLSRLLHPDKRPPGRERDVAQDIFTELMNACEYLHDGYSRCLYFNVPQCSQLYPYHLSIFS
jgi:preprotein translocase subunit Sec63